MICFPTVKEPPVPKCSSFHTQIQSDATFKSPEPLLKEESESGSVGTARGDRFMKVKTAAD